MKYEGKLYCKLWESYFDSGKTSEDWDQLESQIKMFQEICVEDAREKIDLELKLTEVKNTTFDFLNELDNYSVEIPQELHELFNELEKLVK